VTLGEAFRPRLTVDGLRNLLLDLRTSGRPIPRAIIVSEYDRRDLNQDLLGTSVAPVAKADQAPEHDGQAIGVIEGVVIASHRDIPRGKARLFYGPRRRT
jgi:hypothetical protein